MVRIWKIGSLPGLKRYTTAKENKRWHIKYALSQNFVAIGFGFVSDIRKLSENEIRKSMVAHPRTEKSPDYYSKQITTFAKNIKQGDVVLLYNQKSVYVGIVRDSHPYYYVEIDSEKDYFKDPNNPQDRAPHRINVEWQFNKSTFFVDFSSWRDTIHEVLEIDFRNKDMDEELREYLLHIISENPPTPPTPLPRRPPEREYEGLPPEYYEEREKKMKKEKEIEEEFNQINDYVIQKIIAIVKKKLMESQYYSSMVGIAQRNNLEEDDIWPDVDYDYVPFGLSGCGLIFHNDGSELMRVLSEDYSDSTQSIPFGEEIERWGNYVVNEIKKLCQIFFNRIIFVE